MLGLARSYSLEKKILPSSYLVYLTGALESKQHPYMMVFMGSTYRRTEKRRAMRLGTIAYLGIPLGSKLDQVRLPKQ